MEGLKKFSLLIVDDEPLALRRLSNLCKSFDLLGDIRTETSALTASRLIEEWQPDILLLDIDMPEISGLELAELANNKGRSPAIIFTTAHSHYAVSAYRLAAIDYLLKPVKKSLLSEALLRAKNYWKDISKSAQLPKKSTKDWLWVRDRDGSVRIMADQIERVEAERDYMRIYAGAKNYMMLTSMAALLEFLPAQKFIRVHRSTIVHRDMLQFISKRQRVHFLTLKDGIEVRVGPKYLASLRDYLEA